MFEYMQRALIAYIDHVKAITDHVFLGWPTALQILYYVVYTVYWHILRSICQPRRALCDYAALRL